MDTSKKDSAQRQIESAIALLRQRKLDCAITLAAAAENMLPTTDEPHLHQALQTYHDHNEFDINLVINWLKHSGEPFNAIIAESEGVIVIARAITKFIAIHFQASQPMVEFIEWAIDKGYLPDGFRQISSKPTTQSTGDF